jgi:thiol-disulfide isomerase/thioredoxin
MKPILEKLRPSPVTLILLGLVAYLWFRPPAWVEDVREPAPDTPVAGLAGVRGLADLKGKVVLVNFWATWCPYCRHEMPAMEAFYRDYRGRGFEIVAYSLDEPGTDVAAFMRREGYDFPASLADGQVTAAFGGVGRMPTSFVIDRDGLIRHKVSGQVHYGRLKDLILPLLDRPGRS